VYLALAGGTMTGTLTLDGAPTADLHAANKAYVDNAVGTPTDFSDTKSYSTGEVVTFGGKVYRAKTTISPAAFDPTQWDELASAAGPFLPLSGGVLEPKQATDVPLTIIPATGQTADLLNAGNGSIDKNGRFIGTHLTGTRTSDMTLGSNYLSSDNSGLVFGTGVITPTNTRSGAGDSNVVDLGNGATRFKDIYTQGKVSVGNFDGAGNGTHTQYENGDVRYEANTTFSFFHGTAKTAQLELPGATLPAAESIVTREKGDARYLQLSGNTKTTQMTGDVWIGAFDESNTSVNGVFASKGGLIQTQVGSAGAANRAQIECFYGTTKNFRVLSDGRVLNVGGTMGTVSDRRLKTDIQSLDYGLDTINQLKPSRFVMKDNPTEEKIGFIAQDVQAVIPEIVSMYDEEESDILALKTGDIIPVLVKAVQELTAKVTELEAKLEAKP
jgi:hypothetical protein